MSTTNNASPARRETLRRIDIACLGGGQGWTWTLYIDGNFVASDRLPKSWVEGGYIYHVRDTSDAYFVAKQLFPNTRIRNLTGEVG